MANQEDVYLQELLDTAESFDVSAARGLDFCEVYRDKLRKILNLAITLLSIFNPKVAAGLKMIRDRLDELCPAS